MGRPGAPAAEDARGAAGAGRRTTTATRRVPASRTTPEVPSPPRTFEPGKARLVNR